MAASLLAGACGSSMAAVIGMRFGYLMPMTLSIVVSIASVVLLQLTTHHLLFLAAIVINGWAWNFGSAYRMGLVADLDTTGRFTPLISGMQTLGSSFGPMLADGSFALVYLFASLLWVAAWVFYVLALKQQHLQDNIEVLSQEMTI